ncbi:penicillin-binding protein 2 [Nocardioides sp. YR527]|uniref:penicillin-binding protein 2 n=1 Tax=Nocardioides sp. YR527 TaxID=1881028 RepID=UPI0008878FB5|nr:penicillin-binding protein 2 [Nocardioides sp. YR527]SDK81753.1 penicillin-binding protein 2 [Nocardioides sp. YR527]
MPASRLSTAQVSRLRLIVIQALVFSLLATLGVRLFYLQVRHGDAYQAAAASQSKREIVRQPVRGIIVDAQGRPIVTNRSAWVVSLDQGVLDGLDDDDRKTLMARVAKAVDVSPKKQDEAIANWSGTRYQPVPIATDVSESTALRILEQPEDFPGVVAEKQTLRSYPSPFGINAAGVLGYLSPITEDENDNAKERGDESLNITSMVGRSGVEKEYDQWLRGMPGYDTVTVDSVGREIGRGDSVASQPGDTLVTSIDAKVQGRAEKLLAESIETARNTFDKISGRNFEADSGSVVVMEAQTGRLVAMANQPTYDPEEWVGGITQKQLDRLYSEKAGYPLLPRATQGQFAPGSTWKPFMTVGALNNGYSRDTLLNCSSGLQVGNRVFKNYESGAYGFIDFAKALQVSCNTFFYQVGVHYWQKYGANPADVNAKDPLVETAKAFGFGKRTGIDLPGESAGRIADRKWKAEYYEAMKGYYCRMDEKKNAPTDFLQLFAHEFCIEGNYYRTGDAVNFSIGQGDTMVTPIQLARAYASLANGGTLYEPRIGKAVVSGDGTVVEKIDPKVAGKVKMSAKSIDYVNEALLGTPQSGSLAWKFGGFPLDEVKVRGKTGTAEVTGKQTTGWVATYNKKYVVIMTISQGGTGSGSVGDAVRKLWESLYGIEEGGAEVRPDKAAIRGVDPPRNLPAFGADGSIVAPKD